MNKMWAKLFLLIAVGVFLQLFFQVGIPLTVVAVFFIYLITGGWRFAYVVFKTLPRDLIGLSILIKVQLKVRSHIAAKNTVAKLFQAQTKKHPQKPCFIFEDQTWTFQDMEDYTNQVANFFYEAGYRKGDVVSLFLENRPEYICFWLGLSKIGVVSALINFNLRQEPLAHSIKAADSLAMIFGGEMSEAVKDILSDLPSSMRLYCSGKMVSNDLTPMFLDQLLPRASKYPPPAVDQSFRDKLFYVYTSGTTGLPKAAVVSHTRFFYMSYGVNKFFGIKGSDIIYNTLPLYHTAGGMLGVGQVMHCGAVLVIRKKFSASQFWSDCVRYKCTIAQYIGEICRYLLAQPHHPEEQQHRVRLMFGNGVKPQIWRQFQDRFGVGVIGEFYGATEGNCNIVNFENKVGSVGFTTRILPMAYPVTLVKVDMVTGEYVRDSNGVCVHAQPGELGELAGKIIKGNPVRDFDGYVNQAATKKKILQDVWKKGDAAFMTGDVLVMDEFGYMYFHDRTGDTFRWRGENVSTNEVEAVISNHVNLKDAVVYGVEVPGAEGRAGMAAIDDQDQTLDLSALTSALQRSLPPYARPLFLRLMKEADTTGTFKLKKIQLRDEGFNPNQVTDRLYYFNSAKGQYESLTPAIHSDICSGKLRL